MTISARIMPEGNRTTAQVRTITTTTNTQGTSSQEVTEDCHQRFHIASLTKLLVSVALFIAANRELPPERRTNTQTEQDEVRDAWKRFRHIYDRELNFVNLYNSYRPKNKGIMDAFDKSAYDFATIVDLLRHFRGFYSANFQMLSPYAESIMKLSESRSEIFDRIPRGRQPAKWRGYSNLNYTAIALVIEAMWGGTFESFMHANLFEPLKMNLKSTCIGIPDTESDTETVYVVNSAEKTLDLQRRPYRSDGAEAAALGAYSTAHDLDLVHQLIADTIWKRTVIPGCDYGALKEHRGEDRERERKEKEKEMDNRENKEEKNKKKKKKNDDNDDDDDDTEYLPKFTPLGIFTQLSSSDIGSLSINRAQFPEDNFSTYTVLPEDGSHPLDVYYMTGSTNGCSCVSVLSPGTPGTPTISGFSVIVLTNTSGPVDAADHISRLILQKVAMMVSPPHTDTQLAPSVNIVEMVEQNCVAAFELWQKTEAENRIKVSEKKFGIGKILRGEFVGDGFNQRLVITEGEDGKLWLAVDGPVHLVDPLKSRLYWTDEFSVKMFIEPHLSIDSLAQGDWANIIFQAEDRNGEVVALSCETPNRNLRFTKRT